MDIMVDFPIASNQLKFLIVGVDYFVKWVKTEDVSKIKTERVLQEEEYV